ncbi:hypothetical protein Q9L58_000460 [Maublancomyces gigas]|uniref:Uncharacterized protein n=1 Tax=Discina gigas TaxID=1032678 RepID=A0ABR3GX17_9PEZI
MLNGLVDTTSRYGPVVEESVICGVAPAPLCGLASKDGAPLCNGDTDELLSVSVPNAGLIGDLDNLDCPCDGPSVYSFKNVVENSELARLCPLRPVEGRGDVVRLLFVADEFARRRPLR